MNINFSITKYYEFDLSKNQISLIKELSKGGSYFHGKTMDLADETPGVVDTGECYYKLNEIGWRIFEELNKKQNQ